MPDYSSAVSGLVKIYFPFPPFFVPPFPLVLVRAGGLVDFFVAFAAAVAGAFFEREGAFGL